ncbi:hypothetical protein SM39_2596 [Serratia marcescens SM39]|uniref:Uncharacterized protein n=1 Tax=Serratia marcescens SM39 TaxID=1334564 RepID=A0AAT9F2S5_SERMA|nr:hypothetical protein SM39_2596 [Serratia marcescens SM39]
MPLPGARPAVCIGCISLFCSMVYFRAWFSPVRIVKYSFSLSAHYNANSKMAIVNVVENMFFDTIDWCYCFYDLLSRKNIFVSWFLGLYFVFIGFD